jgi:amino acid transporter
MEQTNNLFELQIDHQGSSFLREIAKWSKFLSIVGFIMIGLMLLIIIFAGTAMSALFATTYGTQSSGTGVFQIILVACFLLIYFFPCLYLYKFSTRMQVALRNNDQETLNSSFENLKSCFKFMGIFMIIILSIYALVFLVGLFSLSRL